MKLVVMMMQSIDDEDLILIWPEWANFSISKQFKRVKPQDSNRPHFSHFITLKFCLIKSRLLWIVSCPLLGYQQWCCCVHFSFNFVFVVFQSKRISVRICQPFLNLKDLVTIFFAFLMVTKYKWTLGGVYKLAKSPLQKIF